MSFKPNSGKLMTVTELSKFLDEQIDISIDSVRLINLVGNEDGELMGGSSSLVSIMGACDDEAFVATFLSPEKVWVLDSDEQEDDYKYSDFPLFLFKHANDVVNNNIDWSSFGLKELDDFIEFFDLIQSIPHEGLDNQDLEIYSDNNSQLAYWGNKLSGLPSYDADNWSFAGIWLIEKSSEEISLNINELCVDGNTIPLSKVHENLSEKLFEDAWAENGVDIGLGILKLEK
jgi:hypothetical protein